MWHYWINLNEFRGSIWDLIRGETSVLWLGGDELVFPDQKGVADVVPDRRTLLINFPQIVGGERVEGWVGFGKNFRDIAFFSSF